MTPTPTEPPAKAALTIKDLEQGIQHHQEEATYLSTSANEHLNKASELKQEIERRRLAEEAEKKAAAEKAAAAAEIKVGDLVVCAMSTACCGVSYGRVYEVANIDEPYPWGRSASLVGMSLGYPLSWFRKADLKTDRVAIETYLLRQAEEKGFRVGVKVERYHRSSATGPIHSLHCVFPGDNLQSRRLASADVYAEQNKLGKPFVAAIYSEYNTSPVRYLTILPDEPAKPAELPEIIVTVDGVGYTAKFNDVTKYGVVCFGCAIIAVRDLRAAHALMHPGSIEPCFSANRQIEAVKIGKGLFTREILDRIIERLNGLKG